jgi:hypothetical protein
MGVLGGLTAAKLFLHLLLSGRYGYFRDELYYFDTARHLAWGYVDMAPLAAVYARIALLLGGSLHVVRAIPALAGAGVVALTILITRQLGGNRFAQFLAGLAALISPAVLAVDNILSMNAFEPLFWMGCVFVLIRILRTGNSRLWPWFGVLAGLGLENKHSTVFFGFAVTIALLLTEHRREFLKPWLWIAAAIAVLIFLPNLIWQVLHHFPTLEDLENVRRMGKNVVLGPVDFIGQQILTVHPILLPLWLAGLVSFFRQRRTRMLGWTFVVFFLTMLLMHAKVYYLFPIYPMMLAGGAAAFERWLETRLATRGRLWARAAIVTVIVLAAIPIDLTLLPVLPPEKYVAYTRAIHFTPPKAETHHESVWPQPFADQMGWEQLVQEVAQVYRSLPLEERRHTMIFANNYGEAGAINFFGPRYGLPPAVSAHQNHFFWGPPKSEPDTVIVLQDSRARLEELFNSVREGAVHYNEYGMAEENRPIYLCLGPKFKFAEIWPKLKKWN